MSFKEKKIVVFKAKLNFYFFLCFRSFSNFIIDIPLSFYNQSSFSIAQFFITRVLSTHLENLIYEKCFFCAPLSIVVERENNTKGFVLMNWNRLSFYEMEKSRWKDRKVVDWSWINKSQKKTKDWRRGGILNEGRFWNWWKMLQVNFDGWFSTSFVALLLMLIMRLKRGFFLIIISIQGNSISCFLSFL